MLRDFPLAEPRWAQALAWLEEQDPHAPVEPRLAAKVALVRDGSQGIEVFLLRRPAAMPFDGSVYGFPGGVVDPADVPSGLPWAGPSLDRWARALDTGAETAGRLIVAAARELFEETGVLLAATTDSELIEDCTAGRWTTRRQSLIDRQLTFGELLERGGLQLRSDLLRPWSRWLTPEFEHRRFDTVFFVAAVPVGQCVQVHPGEADWSGWVPALEAAAWAKDAETRGRLLPATQVTLEEIARCSSAAAALTKLKKPRTIALSLQRTGDRPFLRAEIDEPRTASIGILR